MTEPSWGEFTGTAADELQVILSGLSATKDRCSEGEHAARAEALADVCGRLQPVVRRFGPLVADAGAVAGDELASLELGLESLNRELRRAAAVSPPAPDPVASRLADTARMLSLGGDVLASHHAPSGQPRSQYAAYLDSPAAAYEILAEAAATASMAGFTAMHLARLSPPVRRYSRDRAPLSTRVNVLAGQLELTATSINNRFSFAWPPAAMAGSSIGELPLAPSGPPVPVQPGESMESAHRAVVTSSEWLAAQVVRQQAQRMPDLSVVELRSMANHISRSQLLGARLIEHSLDAITSDATSAGGYVEAAARLRTSSLAWRSVGTVWHDTFASIPTGTSPPVLREAEFIAVRLGRTLFTSGWTPLDGFRRPTRDTDQIVQGPDSVVDLLSAVRAVAASGEVLAEHFPQITTSMVRGGVLLSSDPSYNPHGDTLAAQMARGWTRWYATAAEQIVPVVNAYNAARTASADADTAIGQAAAAEGIRLPRARLDADRRQTLAFTGDPALDTQRVRASAARARSVLTPPQKPDEPRDFKERARAMRREIADVHGTERARNRYR
ncbi:hypothetical protein ACGFX4_20095 [Kitasatospora sp. NPDC048365]|uniref:hypothetical protein n=1 Tax=Kitasatospora sp. NPDC048365 TaxID=3364050 RepID=UPI003711DD7C